MTKIQKTFGTKKVLLPVIHVENEEQALRNVERASNAGCKGVFLINHRMKFSRLFKIADVVHEKYPKMWLGMNTLDLDCEDSVRECPEYIRGIWTDDPQLNNGDAFLTIPNITYECIRDRKDCLYFGGVAFKYQTPVPDGKLREFSELATKFMDVVTTSGDGTGEAAYIGKIVAMKEAIGDAPLGIASGITLQNIDQYLPYVDCFLVATGVSDSFTELSEEKLKELNYLINTFTS